MDFHIAKLSGIALLCLLFSACSSSDSSPEQTSENVWNDNSNAPNILIWEDGSNADNMKWAN